MSFTLPPSAPTAAPPTPSRGDDPNVFDAKANAHVSWLGGFATWLIGFIGWLGTFLSELSSTLAEIDAATSVAAGVLADSGALPWVSGATYAVGDRAYSTITARVYRRKIAGSGATDPSADSTNWAIAPRGLRVILVTGTTATGFSEAEHVMKNAAQSTYTFPLNPVEGDSVCVQFKNTRVDNILARNGQTIMGLAEDMTVDSPGATISFRFTDNTWSMH